MNQNLNERLHKCVKMKWQEELTFRIMNRTKWKEKKEFKKANEIRSTRSAKKKAEEMANINSFLLELTFTSKDRRLLYNCMTKITHKERNRSRDIQIRASKLG